MVFLAILILRPQGLFQKSVKVMRENLYRARHPNKPFSFLAWPILILVFSSRRPFSAGDQIYLLIEIFSYLALASLWNLLAGYTGLVSVGQQAFVGLGGYRCLRSRCCSGSTALGCPLPGRSLRFSLFRPPGSFFVSGALTSPLAPGSWPRSTGWFLPRSACSGAAPAQAFPLTSFKASRKIARPAIWPFIGQPWVWSSRSWPVSISFSARAGGSR